MPAKRLFISYSTADSDFAEKLHAQLEAAGYDVFRDKTGMTAGPLDSQLKKRIDEIDALVLIFSRHAIGSDWVEWEVQMARNRERRDEIRLLCPIQLDDSWRRATWRGPLMHQVEDYYIVDFSQDFRPAFKRLREGLERFYGPESDEPADDPERGEQPRPAGELTLELEVTGGELEASSLGEKWRPANPLDDEELIETIRLLEKWGTKPLPADEHGSPATAVAGAAAALQHQSALVGERLASLLPEKVRERLRELTTAAREAEPALMRLNVSAATPEDEALADRVLALPWELLRLGDDFPVREHTLDLVREAVVPSLHGLEEPEVELKVVATVAAPIDQVQLNHEDEMYRLWRALGASDEGRLRVTDLGTLEDLAGAVGEHEPVAVHFTGHGTPGALVFEDDAARGHEVAVGDLVSRLNAEDAPLPRLIYLSACHGLSAGDAASSSAGDGEAAEKVAEKDTERQFDQAAVATQPSTAAALHRAGFAQVVGYFGPVSDEQATRTAAAFYAALAHGSTARAALRQARQRASMPVQTGDGWAVYPLGWAQLALYHRGADCATAVAATGVAPLPEAPPVRAFVRLDQQGGAERVERRHDVPIIGVQQLRHGFIGRRAPRAAAIRRWREGHRLIVVQGLGGLGKTALCTELLRILDTGKVLALDGRFAGAQPDAMAALWQEVQAARPDDEEWSATLGQLQKDGLTARALAQALVHLTRLEGRLTVYLDDAESLQQPLGDGEIGRWRSNQLRQWWSLLLQLARQHGPFGLIASSRYRPESTPEDAILRLEPMSHWETVRMTSWLPTLRRISHGDREWLAGKIEGHPRTIEWLEVLAKQKAEHLAEPGSPFEGDWRRQILEPVVQEAGAKIDADLLLEEVWQALDAEAQEHLGRCTVLTTPTPWAGVQALAPAECAGSARMLADTGLLSPFQSPEKKPWWAPHRLVSEAVQKLWHGDAADAHRTIGRWYQQRFEESSTVSNAQRTVEHLCAAGDGDAAFPTAESLVLHLRGAGRYREALSWVDRTLEAGATGHRQGLLIMYQVQLLRKAGELPKDGEKRLLRALELVKTENAGNVLHNLGSFCRAGGRLGEAATYLQRAVDAKIEVHGEESTDVATSLHELAGVLQAQGELAAAREHLERSLKITQKVFGTDIHPDVAASMNNLAGILAAQGELNEARKYLERSLEIFGTEMHPDVAASLHSLAEVLQAQGDLEGARARLERVLEIEAAVYGSREHYSTAETEMALGMLLFKLDEPEKAAKLLVHAYQVFQTQLGPDHPLTRQLAPLFEQSDGGQDDDS